MNKNLFLRLCLMMGVFSIVFSCKTELLEDESTNPTTQNAIAKQILFKELQKQAPQIAKKVSKFSPVDISARTYTDSENDFSIDTEKSLYIEDAKGNKTYTFKMTRAEHNEAVLENLVLKDIGNGEFEAYIATYDSYALQNYSNLSLEDVKNHITMVYIGDRLGSEIFGKANAYTCYVMAPEFVDVYYTGEICGANLHYYGQTCNDEIKPTPGYTITTVQYTPYDMCEGGGASAGSGDGSGVTTSPYGYNGGGGGISGLKTPCGKISELFLQLGFTEKYEEMTNPSVFNLNHEKVYAVKKTNTAEPEYISADLQDCATEAGGIAILDDPLVYGLMHDHQNQTCNPTDLPPGKFPSHIDIKTFINTLMPHALASTGSYANAYSLITTSEGNYMLMYSGTNNPGSINENQLKQLKKDYEKSLLNAYTKPNYDQKDVEAELLRFIKDKINKPGLEVYRVTSTTATKIEYNFPSPNKIKETPCN